MHISVSSKNSWDASCHPPSTEVTHQISGERYLTDSLVIVFNRTQRGTQTNIYENKIPNDPTLHQSAIAAAKKIKNELCVPTSVFAHF
jgi:hypothetical protein